ncbi:phosphoadenosine phosphosulfate reductase family protein [Catellatospora sp. NPDC049133]|uniref:phosphoadenosine phosphosulfate reductase domain-containing protein n=1 Tax=Catellatospora sp. NPDC049133 TaxID=3155499 RepID=UPI0033DEC3E7
MSRTNVKGKWEQPVLVELPPAPRPELSSFDRIIINSSGGKDSQACLDVVVQAARAAGALDRVVVLHCDMGRMEWPGTLHLARRQAAAYDLPFFVRKRVGLELLEYIRSRVQKRWPDARNRFCTSDFKRGVGAKFITEQVAGLDLGRRPRVLYVMGMRGAESCARAAMTPFEVMARWTSRNREVWQWLPLHDWTTDQVWHRIRSAGTPVHPVYSYGLSRASCSLCVLASIPDLMRACQLVPDLAAEYTQAEVEMDHDFRFRLPIAEVIARAAAEPVQLPAISRCRPCRGAGERPGEITACPACHGTGGMAAYALAA